MLWRSRNAGFRWEKLAVYQGHAAVVFRPDGQYALSTNELRRASAQCADRLALFVICRRGVKIDGPERPFARVNDLVKFAFLDDE